MKKIVQNKFFYPILAILAVILLLFLLGKAVPFSIYFQIKIGLAVSGLTLVIFWRKLRPEVAKAILIILVIFSCVNFAPRYISQALNSYDTIHYFLGAKYFKEVGYLDLYPALLVADHENTPYSKRLMVYRVQDEKGFRYKKIEHGLKRGREIREAKFSPQRWRQFEHDFLYLQRQDWFSKPSWHKLVMDMGFNGSPGWIFLAQPLTNVFPVEWIRLINHLDVILLAIALFFIRWAYGGVAALWTLFFLMITYSLRFPIPGKTFFRYVWVPAIMVAMALLKKGKPFWGGVLAGLSTVLRTFPVIWMFGPAMQGFLQLIFPKKGSPRWNRNLVILAGGFLITVSVLLGGAGLKFGFNVFSRYSENVATHIQPENIKNRHIGFQIGTAYDGHLEPKTINRPRKSNIQEWKLVNLTVALIILGFLSWGIRRIPMDEAFGLGFIPLFLLTTFYDYYAISLVTLIIVHAANLFSFRNRVGLIILFAIEAFTNWSRSAYPGHKVFLIGWMSWGLILYCLIMTTWIFIESLKNKGEGKDKITDLDQGVPITPL